MTLTGISSMATKALLADLVADFEARSGVKVVIESVGGVDAAKRVAAGEVWDVVLLASDALDTLIAAGHALAPRVDYVQSPVAVAIPAGAAVPDISSEAALRAAVAAATSIGYSTGPSGQHLMRLFERWGMAQALQARTVQAQPGIPVGRQIASGEVHLGFQQVSELQGVPGVQIIGLLPPDCAFITTFSGAVAARSTQRDAARIFLSHLNDAHLVALKQRHGMSALPF
jgi:molybdate transport system substrate-binding protein